MRLAYLTTEDNLELLTRKQIAEALQITPEAFDRIRKKIGLEPVIKNPLRFTLESFINKERESRIDKEVRVILGEIKRVKTEYSRLVSISCRAKLESPGELGELERELERLEDELGEVKKCHT